MQGPFTQPSFIDLFESWVWHLFRDLPLARVKRRTCRCYWQQWQPRWAGCVAVEIHSRCLQTEAWPRRDQSVPRTLCVPTVDHSGHKAYKYEYSQYPTPFRGHRLRNGNSLTTMSNCNSRSNSSTHPERQTGKHALGSRQGQRYQLGSDVLQHTPLHKHASLISMNSQSQNSKFKIQNSKYHIVLNIIPTLHEGYIVSVHRMVMKNRPVNPGSIQGSHRPMSFIRIKYRTRANDLL